MSEHPPTPVPRQAPEPPDIELISATVEPADGPRECTIYPPDASETAIMTTWITAKEDAFVRRYRMR